MCSALGGWNAAELVALQGLELELELELDVFCDSLLGFSMYKVCFIWEPKSSCSAGKLGGRATILLQPSLPIIVFCSGLDAGTLRRQRQIHYNQTYLVN